jgi:hypothetical protein
MSKDTTDEILANIGFIIVAYIATEIAFKAYRSSKRRRMTKYTAAKTVAVLKATTKPVKVIKTKVR